MAPVNPIARCTPPLGDMRPLTILVGSVILITSKEAGEKERGKGSLRPEEYVRIEEL